MRPAQHQRLWDAMVARPDDDGPRQVYADWLADGGDVARADLIRTQLDRARRPRWDPERIDLDLHQRTLLAAHGAAWSAELPDLEGVVWGPPRRGFVGRVAFADDRFLEAHASAVLAAAPLEGIAVRWPRRSGWSPLGAQLEAALADAPSRGFSVRRVRRGDCPLPTVPEVTVYGTLMDPGDVDWIASSSGLSDLRRLNLIESGLDADGLARLLATDLGALTALRLPHHRFGSDGVARLVDATTLGALTELDLSVATTDELGSQGRYTTAIDEYGAVQLASWPQLARIHTLDLSGNFIGPDGLRALLSSPLAAGIRSLDLRGISDDEVLEPSGFAQAHPALRLEALALGDGGLDFAGAEHLAEAGCLSGLKVLCLDRLFDTHGWAFHRLVEAPWFDGLEVLELRDCYGRAFLEALLERRPASLHTVVMPGSFRWSRGDALGRLARSDATDGWRVLDLSANDLGDAACTLGESPHLRSLIRLDVSDNDLTTEVAARLARSAVGQRLISLTVGVPEHDRLPNRAPVQIPCQTYRGPLRDL